MLANDQGAVAQSEALAGIGSDSGIERRVPDGDARRCCDYPPDVLVVAVPQLDAERQLRRDVVKIGIGQLAQKRVHAVVEIGRRAPQLAAFGAEPFEQPERVELTFIPILPHKNVP